MAINESDQLPTYLDQKQVASILAAAKAAGPVPFGLLLVTYRYGLRVGEAVALDRADYNPEAGRLKIRRLKGSLTTEAPLFNDVRRALDAYLAGRRDRCPALFSGVRGRLSRRTVERLFAAAAGAAGVQLPPRRNVHILKHSIAVHLLDSGMEIKDVQEWLGHRSTSSTNVYARISHHRRRHMVETLEQAPTIARLD